LVYFLEIIGLRSKGGVVFALRKIKEEMDLMSTSALMQKPDAAT
jgi:hypothetical protein